MHDDRLRAIDPFRFAGLLSTVQAIRQKRPPGDPHRTTLVESQEPDREFYTEARLRSAKLPPDCASSRSSPGTCQ